MPSPTPEAAGGQRLDADERLQLLREDFLDDLIACGVGENSLASLATDLDRLIAAAASKALLAVADEIEAETGQGYGGYVDGGYAGAQIARRRAGGL